MCVVAHGPWKKLTDFGSNPDCITLELGLGLHYGGDIVTKHLFNGNNFATSAKLAEVCALVSVIILISLLQSLTETEIEKKITDFSSQKKE